MKKLIKYNPQKFLKESYFSKDIYDKKRGYAHKTSSEGIESIAEQIVFKKARVKSIIEFIEAMEEKGISEEKIKKAVKKIEGNIEDIIEELTPLARLSHARHEMHSSNVRSDETSDIFDYIGNQYSVTETLLDKVKNLNKKYKLSNVQLNTPQIPEVNFSDSDEDIYDYLDVSDSNTPAYELLQDEWRRVQDKASENIRAFFKQINKKFKTNFPD